MPPVPPITYSPSYLQNLVKKNEKILVKVGFISKFFGIFEPHGMLLDGIMKYLPKSIFYVIALPIARTDGKPLSPVIRESANEIYEIPLTHEYAREIIMNLKLDLLVYADTVSEPMTHFLSHSRLAPIQMVPLLLSYTSILYTTYLISLPPNVKLI
jgi:predicted O-linked N-acetylglucosamine transferase (SPINDLY family)